MDQQRLQNAARGVTVNQEGKEFSFTSPIPGLHIYDNIWPDSDAFFEKLLTKEFWETNLDIPGARTWVREDFFDDVEYTKDNGKKSLGVIAQEVVNVCPELVTSMQHNGESILTLDYGRMAAYLIEAIKELKAEIDTLKSNNNP